MKIELGLTEKELQELRWLRVHASENVEHFRKKEDTGSLTEQETKAYSDMIWLEVLLNRIETLADNQKAFNDRKNIYIERHPYRPLSEAEKQGLTEEEIFRKEYGLYTDFVYHRKWVEKFKEIYGREPEPH